MSPAKGVYERPDISIVSAPEAHLDLDHASQKRRSTLAHSSIQVDQKLRNRLRQESMEPTEQVLVRKPDLATPVKHWLYAGTVK
jgi:hypothetical protein